MAKTLITQEQIMEVLDKGYDLAIKGLPKFDSCETLARSYTSRYDDPQEAVRHLVNWQITKCSTSGFLTSLGGLITLPVAIPANIASVLYVQLRMIAAIAYIAGYDPKDDQVQALVYMCLVGMSAADILKKPGVLIANKVGISMVKKIPGEVIKKINQKVGFRLLTKFGEKGIINLAKLVPILGGAVGGTVDFLSTRAIASYATKMFFEDRPLKCEPSEAIEIVEVIDTSEEAVD